MSKTKNKIQVSNIMHVVDIHENQVNPATLGWLNGHFITYEDKKLKEHLINIHDAAEEALQQFSEILPHTKFTAIIIDEVMELQRLCNKHDSGYIRFING